MKEILSKIKIFADGADLNAMTGLVKNPLISGFTTNPTLMKSCEVSDYHTFAKLVLQRVGHSPVSFEVLSDDFEEMERQALEISSWASNVYVKIPVVNSKGLGSYKLIEKLAEKGVKINVTAVLTIDQTFQAASALQGSESSIISIFCGRIADTGENPEETIRGAKMICHILNPKIEVLWASPREVYNVVQAVQCDCDIITLSSSLLEKLKLFGKNLNEYSIETVKMFLEDSIKGKLEL